jgi:hypothetical protein
MASFTRQLKSAVRKNGLRARGAYAVFAINMATENRLKTLPDIDRLKALCQSLAMLDAIMSLEWEYRYFSFDSKWDLNEMMASMRNGQGDDFYILFNKHGAIIKGFDHESPMSPYARKPKRVWPGVLDDVPDVFRSFLDEPAFTIEDTTFCFWRRTEDPCWSIGNIAYPKGADPDGSDQLLIMLDGKPEKYREYAEECYERDIPLLAIEHIYNHQPLTDEIITSLNPDISFADLKAEIETIGYSRIAA